MKNEQKAREYAEKFFSAQPQGFFKPLDEKTKGMHLILRMLARRDRKSTRLNSSHIH